MPGTVEVERFVRTAIRPFDPVAIAVATDAGQQFGAVASSAVLGIALSGLAMRAAGPTLAGVGRRHVVRAAMAIRAEGLRIVAVGALIFVVAGIHAVSIAVVPPVGGLAHVLALMALLAFLRFGVAAFAAVGIVLRHHAMLLEVPLRMVGRGDWLTVTERALGVRGSIVVAAGADLHRRIVGVSQRDRLVHASVAGRAIVIVDGMSIVLEIDRADAIR